MNTELWTKKLVHVTYLLEHGLEEAALFQTQAVNHFQSAADQGWQSKSYSYFLQA